MPRVKVSCPKCKKGKYHPEEKKHCCGEEMCQGCLIGHFREKHPPVKG